MRIEFIEISRLEAMSMIDSNNTDYLYYAYTYYYNKHGYGDNGRSIRFPTPRDWRCDDPIKYLGVSQKRSRLSIFDKKEVLNEPVKQEDTLTRKQLGHIWLKKIVHAEEYTNMKPPIKLPRKEEKTNNEKI